MVITINGREIEIGFYGPIDDIQCDFATYTDNGEDVDDKTLDQIMDQYASDIELEVMENAIGEAESHFEGDR